jgi:micrococcal nuclease
MQDYRYWYDAKVVNIYDADTAKVEFDLGLDIKRTEDVRLYGINAPELRGRSKEAGYAARDFLAWMLTGREASELEKDGRRLVTDAPCRINTIRDGSGKYGRMLVRIFVEVPDVEVALDAITGGKVADGSWVEVNTELVSQGHAVFRDY